MIIPCAVVSILHPDATLVKIHNSLQKGEAALAEVAKHKPMASNIGILISLDSSSSTPSRRRRWRSSVGPLLFLVANTSLGASRTVSWIRRSRLVLCGRRSHAQEGRDRRTQAALPSAHRRQTVVATNSFHDIEQNRRMAGDVARVLAVSATPASSPRLFRCPIFTPSPLRVPPRQTSNLKV